MKLPAITYLSPSSIEETIALLDQHDGDAKILSGGQSLMPMLAFRLASCSILIDIKNINGLNEIVVSDRSVTLGARVRWRDIEQNTTLPVAHPLLVEAVKHVAHYAIRNRGTVGGSLAHGDPASELPAVAVACGAKINIIGPAGLRSVNAADFFLAPLMTALEHNEMIVSLELPAWPGDRRYAVKEFARRKGDFALAGAIVQFEMKDGCIDQPRIGAFGVGDQPLRLSDAEGILSGSPPDAEIFARAAAAGVADLDIRSDIHADADYRRALLETLILRALDEAHARRPHD